EPSRPPGDAPCPNCGTLLWFNVTSDGVQVYETKAIAPIRDKIARLVGDAGRLDSLEVVEIFMELEEEFDISIPDHEADQIKSIGDAIDYINRRLREREG